MQTYEEINMCFSITSCLASYYIMLQPNNFGIMYIEKIFFLSCSRDYVVKKIKKILLLLPGNFLFIFVNDYLASLFHILYASNQLFVIKVYMELPLK